MSSSPFILVSRYPKQVATMGQNGDTDNILRPRPIKPGNPLVIRAQGEEAGLKSSYGPELVPSGVSRYVSSFI